MTQARFLQTSSNSYGGSDFNPVVFWCVNAFIALLIVVVCSWCFCRYKNTGVRFPTEREAQLSRWERQESQRKARLDTPAKRKRKLLASFRRCQVTKVVTEKDLILDNADVEAPATMEDDDDLGGECNTGHLQITSTRRVPNCCAICLAPYEVGERVVWSSNPACCHAFHSACMLDWLIKMQDGTPCPCCRQDFTDLAAYRLERKITWRADSAFNASALSFR